MEIQLKKNIGLKFIIIALIILVSVYFLSSKKEAAIMKFTFDQSCNAYFNAYNETNRTLYVAADIYMEKNHNVIGKKSVTFKLAPGPGYSKMFHEKVNCSAKPNHGEMEISDIKRSHSK